MWKTVKVYLDCKIPPTTAAAENECDFAIL